MKRKFLILISVFLLFSFTFAYAADISVKPYSGNVTIIENKGGSVIQSDVVYSGENALNVKETIGGKIYALRLDIQKGDTVTFWEKGMVNHYNNKIMLDSKVTSPVPYKKDGSYFSNSHLIVHEMKHMYNEDDYIAEGCPVKLVDQTADGWRKWETQDYVFASIGSTYLRFVSEVESNPEGWYIDDVTVYASDGTIRRSMDFETDYNIDDTGAGNYVRGLSINGGSWGVTVSWRNPNKTITDLTIKEGNTVKVSKKNLDLSPNALNVKYISVGIDSKVTYTVTATIDGVEYSTKMSGQDGKWFYYNDKTADQKPIMDWTISRIGNPYGRVMYDNVCKSDGERSLKLDLNTTSANDAIVLNTYSKDLPAGDYIAEYKTRGVDKSGNIQEYWGAASQKISIAEGENISLKFPGSSSYGTVWVDDVKIYALENGKKVGKNLAVNGSFEENPSEKGYEISVTNSGSSEVVVNYKHSGESALCVKGTANSKVYALKIDIQKGDTVTFWAKGAKHYGQNIIIDSIVDINGYTTNMLHMSRAESEPDRSLCEVIAKDGTWIQYKTKPEVFAESNSAYLRFIGEPIQGNSTQIWYVDDIEVTDAEGNIKTKIGFEKVELAKSQIVADFGTLTSDTSLLVFGQKGKVGLDYNFSVITALYAPDGKLEKVMKTDESVYVENNKNPEICSVQHDFTLDKENDGYSAKTFVWMNGQNPVGVSETIDEISTDKAKRVFDVRRWADEIKELIERCEAEGISTDYETVRWSVLERYGYDYEFDYANRYEPAKKGYLRADLEAGNTERAEWNYRLLNNIYLETKENLESYLADIKKPKAVPRFVQSPVTTEGKIVYTTTNTDGVVEERPYFFTGFGHFGHVGVDMERFPDFGYNIAQQSLEPLTNIVYSGNDEAPFVFEQNRYSEYMHKFFQRAEDNNVKIDLLLGIHSIPTWITDKWPDIIGKDANGNTVSRGIVLRHPKYREMIQAHVKAIMEEFGGYESLNSICLTNEPTTTSAVTYNKGDYVNYLKGIYADINELNSAYGTDYTSFEDVPMLDSDNDLAFYDYKCYNDAMLTEFNKFIADEVKKYNPDMPVHAKMMSITASFDWNNRTLLGYGTQHEFFADFSDYNGNDTYAYIHGKHVSIQEMELFMDIQTGIKDAPCFNSEDHMIMDYNTELSTLQGDHCYSKLWQSYIHGNGFSTIWQWDFVTDPNVLSYGLPPSDPNALVKIADANFDANRLSYELRAIIEKEPEIAILQSYKTRVWNRYAMNSLYNIYWAALQNGTKTELVPELQAGRIHDYDALIIPSITHISAEALSEIVKYAKSGKKILIIGDESLLKDSRGNNSPKSDVDYIYKKAEVIDILANDTNVTSHSNSDYVKIFAELIKELGKNHIQLIDVDTGKAVENVEFEYADYNGKTIINIISYDESKTMKLKVMKDGTLKTNLYDMIDGINYTNHIELEAYSPVLISLN